MYENIPATQNKESLKPVSSGSEELRTCCGFYFPPTFASCIFLDLLWALHYPNKLVVFIHEENE
jgi:hypothetical protein